MRRPVANHPLTPKGGTYALLDTNALIPPRLSDVLFDCAGQGLFFPRWTLEIEKEFVDNWGDVIFSVQKSTRATRKATKLSPPPEHVAAAQKRLKAFRGAVGIDWEIVGYDDPDVILQVPARVDSGDVHLVAACLVLRDSLSEEPGEHRIFLISKNLKHLPVNALKPLGIEVLKPGKFIDSLWKAEPNRMEKALRQTVSDLINYSEEQLLSSLAFHGASETARHFSNLWNVKISTAEQSR
jgi:hypothetical protein